MQYDHERQMRDLEQQFNQKLQQNNIELSRTLATTLGKTIKTHLHKPDTPTISSASSHSLNLINFETFIPKDKPQNIVHVLTKTTSVHHQNTLPTASMTDTLTELILATKEPKLYFQSFKPTSKKTIIVMYVGSRVTTSIILCFFVLLLPDLYSFEVFCFVIGYSATDCIK
jgi:hypothetical protein